MTERFIPKLLQRQKLAYLDASDNVEYLCIHKAHDALTSDPNWLIIRHYYDINGNWTGQKGPLVGKADDRASLNWG